MIGSGEEGGGGGGGGDSSEENGWWRSRWSASPVMKKGEKGRTKISDLWKFGTWIRNLK